MAEGTVTVTAEALPGQRRVRYMIDWVASTGSPSGGVNGTTLDIKSGLIFEIETIPGTGSPGVPTAAYDVTLEDVHGADLLAGAGANLSATASVITRLNPPLFFDSTLGKPELKVSAAGDAATGRIILWME